MNSLAWWIGFFGINLGCGLLFVGGSWQYLVGMSVGCATWCELVRLGCVWWLGRMDRG